MSEAVHHQAEYARNTATGKWRARCTACSWWERIGTREDVTGAFAVHDIEQWQPADPAQPAELPA